MNTTIMAILLRPLLIAQPCATSAFPKPMTTVEPTKTTSPTVSSTRLRTLADRHSRRPRPQSAAQGRLDAGHVQGPARKMVASHLALAHRVEEKLEIPCGARERAQQVVSSG